MQKATFVKSKTELAKRLGVTRVTLDRWLTLPGFPEKQAKGWPLEAAMAFTNRLRQEEAQEDELRLKKLRLEVEQGSAELTREADRYMPRAWVLALCEEISKRVIGIIQSTGSLSPEEKTRVIEEVEKIDCAGFLKQLEVDRR